MQYCSVVCGLTECLQYFNTVLIVFWIKMWSIYFCPKPFTYITNNIHKGGIKGLAVRLNFALSPTCPVELFLRSNNQD